MEQQEEAALGKWRSSWLWAAARDAEGRCGQVRETERGSEGARAGGAGEERGSERESCEREQQAERNARGLAGALARVRRCARGEEVLEEVLATGTMS